MTIDIDNSCNNQSKIKPKIFEFSILQKTMWEYETKCMKEEEIKKGEGGRKNEREMTENKN